MHRLSRKQYSLLVSQMRLYHQGLIAAVNTEPIHFLKADCIDSSMLRTLVNDVIRQEKSPRLRRE